MVVDVVTGGAFGRLAGEVLERLGRDGVVVLVGPHGVGKSTLAAYAAWLALWRGEADAVVSAEEVKTGFASALENLQRYTRRRFLLLYDPVPVTAYYEPHAVRAEVKRNGEETWLAVEEVLSAAGRDIKALVVLPDELYRGLPPKAKETLEKYIVKAVLKDVEFLHLVIKTYSSCEGDYSKLAEEIAQFNGGYTLVAKYAGLWLRERGCDAGDVERAVEEAKHEPKLFFAHYIWHVLLRGNGDLARKAAVPLLLHAQFGPAPIGVTYITKAVKNGVWRFLKPEELEGTSLESLREDALEHIAKWLAQPHEDLVEEVLKDLAGLNGEKARELYKEALGDLIKALDWARDVVLKEGGEILAEFGVPEEDRRLGTGLVTFVVRRLATVFKNGESKHCWKRAALIAGYALAGRMSLWRGQLPEDGAETLSDALKPCAVDEYLTIDGVIPPLSIGVFWFLYYVEKLYARDLSQIRKIRERLDVLTPYANADIIKAVKKTAEELLARWRRRDLNLHEAFYALGLAVLATRGETDEETANLLLYVTSFAAQLMACPVTALLVLETLRPLGEKALHGYVSLLAAASELETLNRKTVLYIYDVLKQLKDRLSKAEDLWPLVEAVRAYSNLVRKHPGHIRDHWEEAVVDMCELYDEVRKRDNTTAPESSLSVQRSFDAIAKVYVLAVALENDALAPLVQRHCGIDDLIKAEDVREALDETVAHPEEFRKTKEDFADWVRVRDVTEDAKRAIEDSRAQLTHVLARYKLNHALDAEKLEETAKEFEKVAEMRKRLKQWGGYLIARSLALRTRVLAARSWEELLERATGFQELWEEAKKHFKPTTEYLITAVSILGSYLVYLAASGNRKMAEELLKKLGLLLSYRPKVSVATRLMLKLLGVGEGARLKEVMDVFGQGLFPELILSMLIDCLRRDKALEERGQLSKAKDRVDSVASATSVQEIIQEIVELLRPCIGKIAPETRPLIDKVDGETLVEVLAPGDSQTRLAFMLLAAVEGRVDAVRLHGLWGSVTYKGMVLQPLFRAVYENCGDLNSKECRLALLKLYYFHF